MTGLKIEVMMGDNGMIVTCEKQGDSPEPHDMIRMGHAVSNLGIGIIGSIIGVKVKDAGSGQNKVNDALKDLGFNLN